MNNDLYDLLKNYAYQSSVKMTTQQIYDFLKEVDYYNRKDTSMAYTYGRDNRYRRYQDTRGDEVATAVLEAYSKGVSFDALLKKNTQVRLYWKQILADKEHKEKQRIREQERLRKLAERRAEEKAKREEVMAKLTQEELEAFGMVKKGKKK